MTPRQHPGSLETLLGVALLVAAGSAAPGHAADAAGEPAITRTADDAALPWGPCPEFMPKGCALAVLHGDPSQDNADVFFRVPGGADLPLHWHSSAERMVLVAGELHVSYVGQDSVVLKPGTYAYGPAKRAHSGRCASRDACVLFIAFESPLDAVPGAGD